MHLLAEVFPWLRGRRLPLSRDQAMLMLMAVMQIGMGIEVYTGHLISGTIVPNEWIPIIFGPTAGIVLIIAGLIAPKRRALATNAATLTFLGSLVVGLLGAFFHLRRAILPAGPIGQKVSLDLLIWAPPIIAPLMFALIGVLGLSAVWLEDPPDSGRLRLMGGRLLQLPLSKTRAFFLWTGAAMMATVISSVLDHARANFQNPWLWIPTVVGVFAMVVTFAMGVVRRPSRGDLIIYLAGLALMTLAGPIGAFLHLRADMFGGGGTLVVERLLKGAPIMAPLLFANMGLLGAIILLDPAEPEG